MPRIGLVAERYVNKDVVIITFRHKSDGHERINTLCTELKRKGLKLQSIKEIIGERKREREDERPREGARGRESWPPTGAWLKKCLLSYPFHTYTERRFDIHPIDDRMGTLAKSDGAPFQTSVSVVPPASFASKRRDFLHQGWTTQTRLDRSTGSDRRLWPLQRRKASWVRRKKVRRALFFSEGMNHGCWEVRRAGAARSCFHGYSPNMRLPLLRSFRSHALSRPMSSEEKHARGSYQIEEETTGASGGLGVYDGNLFYLLNSYPSSQVYIYIYIFIKSKDSWLGEETGMESHYKCFWRPWVPWSGATENDTKSDAVVRSKLKGGANKKENIIGFISYSGGKNWLRIYSSSGNQMYSIWRTSMIIAFNIFWALLLMRIGSFWLYLAFFF